VTQRLTLTVPGEPRGKGRPRASARVVQTRDGPRANVSVHTPGDTRAAEAGIASAFRARYPGHRPWTRAVMLRFVAVFPVPPSWPKYLREEAARGTVYHTSTPDTDNCWKLILDALNDLAWADDAQVQGGGVKRYGSPPRLELTLEPLGGPDLPATPGQRAVERRVRETGTHLPPPGTRKAAKPGSAGRRYDAATQRRIDAALAREGEPR
jgi:Holliday junction resolvase RusA-like endonuclease